MHVKNNYYNNIQLPNVFARVMVQRVTTMSIASLFGLYAFSLVTVVCWFTNTGIYA